MKQIILSIAVLLSVNAFSQVDTSKLSITLNLKQKHIAYMAAELSENNKLNDVPVRDSMRLYIGSGTSPDSIIVTHFKAGVVARFIAALMDDQSGKVYSMMNELATSTAGQGYAGLIPQLNVKKNQVNSEQGVSIWLLNNILDRSNRYGQFLTDKLLSGKNWLLNPIIYN
jgi:hypothetical protein